MGGLDQGPSAASSPPPRDPITTGEMRVIAAADVFCEAVLSDAHTLNPRTLTRVFGSTAGAAVLELLDAHAERGHRDGVRGL